VFFNRFSKKSQDLTKDDLDKATEDLYNTLKDWFNKDLNKK